MLFGTALHYTSYSLVKLTFLMYLRSSAPVGVGRSSAHSPDLVVVAGEDKGDDGGDGKRPGPGGGGKEEAVPSHTSVTMRCKAWAIA